MKKSAGPDIMLIVDASVVFLLAVAIRSFDLDRPFTGNEILHLVAGRSWVTDNTFAFAHGAYERNATFSAFIGWLTHIFGEKPVVARMPALLAGSLTVMALFLWVRAIGGRAAGWCAALLLCGNPLAIGMSQWVRVYALFGLTFFVGSIGVYTVAVKELPRRNALAVSLGSALLLALSLRMHLTVVLGIAGLGLWLVIEQRQKLLELAVKIAETRWALILALLLLLGAVGLALTGDEFWRLVRQFRDLQPQAADKQFDFLFYHRELNYLYPLLWGLTPIAMIFAIARRPSFGLFCSCIFCVVFIVYCLATRKWMRYLYFMLPFLFALWGFLLPHAYRWLTGVLRDMVDNLGIAVEHALIRKSIVTVAMTGSVLFFVATNSIVTPVRDALSGAGSRVADWAGAGEIFSPWLGDSEAVVLASPMQHPIYYYGRADLEFGPKYVYETTPRNTELGVDKRTGLRAVSTRESMELVFRCYGRGLLVMTKQRWRKPGYGPSDEVFEMLQHRAVELPEARNFGLVAFGWEGPRVPKGEECARLLPADEARGAD